MAKLELDAARKGWVCSQCKLFTDALGRPIFGGEMWTIKTNSIHYLENKPEYKFCPGCGEPIEGSVNRGKKDSDKN